MIEEVKVPNVQGISIKDAQKVVKELGLELSIENEAEDLDKENTIIVDQTPKEGFVFNKGNKIYVKY